eukprot:2666973-Amphidinium_carterae.1
MLEFIYVLLRVIRDSARAWDYERMSVREGEREYPGPDLLPGGYQAFMDTLYTKQDAEKLRNQNSKTQMI